jgi:hypothetical protein
MVACHAYSVHKVCFCFAAKESLKQNPHTTGGEGYEEYEAPIWQNDEESNTCTLCQIHFTTLRRKVRAAYEP